MGGRPFSWLGPILALTVTGSQTSRNRADLPQAFNLRVPGGASPLTPGGRKVYDISRFLF